MKNILLLLLLITSSMLSQIEKNVDINKLILESNYSKIVEVLEERIQNNEELSDNDSFYLAIAYQRLVNHRKAIGILSLLSRKNIKDFSVRFALAESYKAMENLRVASSIYHEIVIMDSSNVIARIELAKLQIRRKNFKDAKRHFEYLTNSDSTNYYYMQQYGFSLYKLDKTKEAEEEFKMALRINEYDSKAALWLAKIYFDREEYEEALEIIKKSVKFNPVDLQLNKLGAEILFKMKKYNSASSQYLNVIVLGDSSSIIFQKLGLSLYSSVAMRDSISDKKREEVILEAIEALETSLAKEEFKSALTLTYLGFSYKTLKQYDKSILYLEEALNVITPEYIDKIYSTLGTSYELLDKYRESIIAYSKSLEYNKENPYFTFRLATLYDRYYADKTVALAHYKKYIRTNIDGDEKLIKYAEDSVERLEEAIHFGK